MKPLRYTLLFFCLLGGAAVAQDDISTALELRLQSIEARLPDIATLHRLQEQVQQLRENPGSRSTGGTAPERAESSASGAAAAGGGSFSLLQDVQRLQEQVRKLRGQIQSLQHQIKRQEQGQRALYQDLDRRLRALEQPGRPAIGAGAGGNGATTTRGGLPNVDAAVVKNAYLAAFQNLKEGDYAKARTELEAFVQKYPHTDYSDNAWYWLGEARYIDRRYDEALQALHTVIEHFPNSAKVPGAAYKIGVILDEQGKTAEARKQLQMVANKYADNHAADLARQRLQAIGGN
ncbi:MAG: tol-pal system protein YbgF [Salinisphaera sp.]|nr:tol-pal system protein YbgF [Salinisphaera sp.]